MIRGEGKLPEAKWQKMTDAKLKQMIEKNIKKLQSAPPEVQEYLVTTDVFYLIGYLEGVIDD